MDTGLEGVHVLVTGASGGIGLETIKLYCSLDAEVTAHYNTQYGPLERLSRAYSGFQVVQADLSDETSVKNMFTVIAHAGPVLVLVVNHAICPTEDVPVADMTLGRWNRTIREGHNRVGRQTAGKYGEARHADYAVTKSAMMYGLTMTLENETVKIAPRGRVNTVAPGWVRTPAVEGALADPDVLYRAIATMPLKKLAVPLDIANQIMVLSLSSISGHVTGQVMMVEGGMEGRLLNKPEDI